MKVAANIGLDARGLTIEGRRLPYILAKDAVRVVVDADDLTRVTLTLLADSVIIDPSLTVETDGDVQMVTEPRPDEDVPA